MSRRIGQLVDVSTVREHARIEWEEAHRARLGIQVRIGNSVPWWLVIIAATLFALSVPHTMTVFAQITPWLGYVAPAGIEFGLLYYAFRSKQDRDQGKSVPLFLHALGLLVFVMAIVVNGAGSLQAVVSASESTANLPMAALIEEFDTLPASSQVALLMVPFAALFIPLGTFVAGEGLAKLFLERDEQGDLLSARWESVRASVEFEALRDAALTAGATAKQANRWAAEVSSENPLLSAAGQADGRTIEDTTDDSGRPLPDDGRDQRTPAHGSGQGYSKNMSAREIARQYLEDNPDALSLSVRDLAAAAGIGKTVAAEVRNEFEERRFSSNGHGRTNN